MKPVSVLIVLQVLALATLFVGVLNIRPEQWAKLFGKRARR